MHVSSRFDGGSIGLYDYNPQAGSLSFDLARNARSTTNHWFSFACYDSPDRLKIVIRNAHASLFAHGWNNYHPFIKSDDHWCRAPSAFAYDGHTASLELTNLPPNFALAWYQPYPAIRLAETLGHLSNNPAFTVSRAANLDFIEAGNPTGPHLLVLGRQHPGETMASFFVEGLLNKLADHSPASLALLSRFHFSIVPLVNPAGAAAGFHRTDAEGCDYNLCWGRDNIPALSAIKNYLGSRPSPLAVFDIHGDEVSRNNYFLYNPKLLNAANRPLFDSLASDRRTLAALPMPTDLQSFWHELTHHHRIIFPTLEAAGYFEKRHQSLACVVELNARRHNPSDHIALGETFLHLIGAS